MTTRQARFAVPVLDRWLLHLPLHRVSALVTESAMRQLRAPGPPDGEDPHIRLLQDDLASEPAGWPVPRDGPFDPGVLAIVTTRGCNINCVYCDFGGPTSQKTQMDPATAVRAIDWMAERLAARGRRVFPLHLFGGEPLIAGDLVDGIVRHLKNVCADKGLRPFVDVSTNGVMSLERARWVGDHLDSVVISFDGPPEFQNRNRPGNGGAATFDIVDRTARHLGSTAVELSLRVCVTAESVTRMPDITRWMIETYHPSAINFEPLTENDSTADAGLRGPDPLEYARWWIPSKRLADERGVRLVYSAVESDLPRLSSCPVGNDTVIITPDGAVNGCYLQPADWLSVGMDLRLGSVSAASGVEIRMDQADHLRQLIVDKPRCRGCLSQWSCAGGCHVSNTYPHCQETYVNYCVQTRILTACLLLEELGEAALVDRLLSDDDAMRRLAGHPCDVLVS